MFITFLLGLILGILIRDIKTHVVKKTHGFDFKEWQEGFNKENTKFFEPVTYEEKYKSAKSIEDLID